jgi:hypothetical protein
MGRECSAYGRDEKCVKIWLKNQKGRDHPEDLGVDGRIKLE